MLVDNSSARRRETDPAVSFSSAGRTPRDFGNTGLFTPQNYFKRIKPSDLPRLQEQLDVMAKNSPDPFAHSAAYFGMTGREGLWAYGNETGFVLIARHPNDPESVLVFPPYGDASTDTIKEALKHRNFPKGNVELGRANPMESRLYKSSLANGSKPADHVTKLDWVCPIHVVSSDHIVSREGPEFRQLRQNFNKAVRQGLSAELLNLDTNAEDVISVVEEWANIGNKPGFSFEDLTAPTKSLLKLMKDNNPLSIHGVVIRDAAKNPIGFWIWHETSDRQAMSLARISIGHIHGIKGAAEFGAVKMAEALQDRGINKICLGGSETDSLNAFKEKLGPVVSTRLYSLRIGR